MSVCNGDLMRCLQSGPVVLFTVNFSSATLTHSEKAQKHTLPNRPGPLAWLYLYLFIILFYLSLVFYGSLLPRSRLAEVLMLCVFGRWTNPL